MTIQDQKNALARMILETDNPAILESLKEAFENVIKQDFWETLSDHQKDEIDLGLAEIAAEQTVAYESSINKHRIQTGNMETISIQINNPKAKQLLKDLAKLNLITIKPQFTLQSMLDKLRINSSETPSLDEITAEVEQVRKERKSIVNL
ncbi:MAG: hypothetical protein ACOYOT_10615 [Bacteroidales bacterium]